MSHRAGKIFLKNVLDVVNALLLGALLVFVVNLVTTSHKQTAQEIAQVQKSEKEQVDILRCWLLSLNGSPITAAQLNACLKGTSLAPTDTSTSQAAPTSTSRTTTVAVTAQEPPGDASGAETAQVPPTSNTQQPTASQPTTSAPPPNPNPGTTQPAISIPSSILQPVINPLLSLGNSLGL